MNSAYTYLGVFFDTGSGSFSGQIIRMHLVACQSVIIVNFIRRNAQYFVSHKWTEYIYHYQHQVARDNLLNHIGPESQIKRKLQFINQHRIVICPEIKQKKFFIWNIFLFLIFLGPRTQKNYKNVKTKKFHMTPNGIIGHY